MEYQFGSVIALHSQSRVSECLTEISTTPRCHKDSGAALCIVGIDSARTVVTDDKDDRLDIGRSPPKRRINRWCRKALQLAQGTENLFWKASGRESRVASRSLTFRFRKRGKGHIRPMLTKIRSDFHRTSGNFCWKFCGNPPYSKQNKIIIFGIHTLIPEINAVERCRWILGAQNKWLICILD